MSPEASSDEFRTTFYLQIMNETIGWVHGYFISVWGVHQFNSVQTTAVNLARCSQPFAEIPHVHSLLGLDLA